MPLAWLPIVSRLDNAAVDQSINQAFTVLQGHHFVTLEHLLSQASPAIRAAAIHINRPSVTSVVWEALLRNPQLTEYFTDAEWSQGLMHSTAEVRHKIIAQHVAPMEAPSHKEDGINLSRVSSPGTRPRSVSRKL